MSERTAIQVLDRRFPIRYGTGDLIGLGQFILNLVQHPSDDPETDAENIAIAVVGAITVVGTDDNPTTLRWVNCEACGGSGEIIRCVSVGPYDDPGAAEYAEICAACEGTGRDCEVAKSP